MYSYDRTLLAHFYSYPPSLPLSLSLSQCLRWADSWQDWTSLWWWWWYIIFFGTLFTLIRSSWQVQHGNLYISTTRHDPTPWSPRHVRAVASFVWWLGSLVVGFGSNKNNKRVDIVVVTRTTTFSKDIVVDEWRRSLEHDGLVSESRSHLHNKRQHQHQQHAIITTPSSSV